MTADSAVQTDGDTPSVPLNDEPPPLIEPTYYGPVPLFETPSRAYNPRDSTYAKVFPAPPPPLDLSGADDAATKEKILTLVINNSTNTHFRSHALTATVQQSCTGSSEEDIRKALRVHNNDVNAAANWLLTGDYANEPDFSEMPPLMDEPATASSPRVAFVLPPSAPSSSSAANQSLGWGDEYKDRSYSEPHWGQQEYCEVSAPPAHVIDYKQNRNAYAEVARSSGVQPGTASSAPLHLLF